MNRDSRVARDGGRHTGAFWRRDDPDGDRFRITAYNYETGPASDEGNRSPTLGHIPTRPRNRAGSLGHNDVATGLNANANANSGSVVMRPTPMTRHLSHDYGSPVQPSPLATPVTIANQDPQSRATPSVVYPANRSVSTPVTDPRLKSRTAPQETAQEVTAASTSGVKHTDSSDEAQLLADLVSVEVGTVQLTAERRQLESKFDSLKIELKMVRRQFSESSPYIEHIVERVEVAESKLALSKSHGEANAKRGTEIRERLANISRAKSLAPKSQDAEDQSLKQEQINAKYLEDLGVVKQQLKQSTDRQKALESQLTSQTKIIDAFQTRLKDLEKNARQENADAERSTRDAKTRVEGLQSVVDSVQTQAKEQKLALARLNDVFISRDVFNQLKDTVDGLGTASSLGQGATSETLMTRKDFEPYISNFNEYGEHTGAQLKEVQTRLDDLGSVIKVFSSDLEKYTKTQDLDPLKRDLTSQKDSLGALNERIDKMDTTRKSLAASTVDGSSGTKALSAIVSQSVTKLEILERKLQAMERNAPPKTVPPGTSLTDADKQALAQATTMTQHIALWQKKIDHSIESLSQRYNNLRTDDLARHILSTLDPSLALLRPQISQLQRQVEEIQPIKASLEGYRKETDGKLADVLARQNGTTDTVTGLMSENTKATEDLGNFQSRQNGLIDRLAAVEEHCQRFYEMVTSVQASSTDTTAALAQIEDYRKAIGSLQEEISDSQVKLREEFVNARDGVMKRLDTLETTWSPNEQASHEDKIRSVATRGPMLSQNDPASKGISMASGKLRSSSLPLTPVPKRATTSKTMHTPSHKNSAANSSQGQKPKNASKSGLSECFSGLKYDNDASPVSRSERDSSSVSKSKSRKISEVIDMTGDDEDGGDQLLVQTPIDLAKWQKPATKLMAKGSSTPGSTDDIGTQNDESTIEVASSRQSRSVPKRKRAIDDSSSPSSIDNRRRPQEKKRTKKK